jgi:hypothetical protein
MYLDQVSVAYVVSSKVRRFLVESVLILVLLALGWLVYLYLFPPVEVRQALAERAGNFGVDVSVYYVRRHLLEAFSADLVRFLLTIPGWKLLPLSFSTVLRFRLHPCFS